MKKVVRYQCTYCRKLAARATTIYAHEQECMKNPDSKNCYKCHYAVQGGFRDDCYGDSEYVKDMPYCTIHESPLSELRYSGRTALNCPNWKPGGEYYTKSQDENGKISDYFGKPLVWKDGELIETEGFEF